MILSALTILPKESHGVGGTVAVERGVWRRRGVGCGRRGKFGRRVQGRAVPVPGLRRRHGRRRRGQLRGAGRGVPGGVRGARGGVAVGPVLSGGHVPRADDVGDAGSSEKVRGGRACVGRVAPPHGHHVQVQPPRGHGVGRVHRREGGQDGGRGARRGDRQVPPVHGHSGLRRVGGRRGHGAPPPPGAAAVPPNVRG